MEVKEDYGERVLFFTHSWSPPSLAHGLRSAMLTCVHFTASGLSLEEHDRPNPCYLKTAITDVEEVVPNQCKHFWKCPSLALYFPLVVDSTWLLFFTLVFVFRRLTPNQGSKKIPVRRGRMVEAV